MMGKASRTSKHTEKMKRRRAAKTAKAAKYAALAGETRRKQNEKRIQPGTFNHETTNCGNPGCKKCGPVLAPDARRWTPRRKMATAT